MSYDWSIIEPLGVATLMIECPKCYESTARSGNCPRCGAALADGRKWTRAFHTALDGTNMTSNIGGMYYKAMPGPWEGGGRYNGTRESEARGGLPGLSGLPCTQVATIIADGLTYMREHPEEMKALEPDNGWGSYDGALSFLEQIRQACLEHPNGILAVNW